MKTLRSLSYGARIVVAVTALALAAGAATPASAALLDPLAPVVNLVVPDCGTAGQPFARWNDNHSYYTIPNNGFESGASGWTLVGGARVVYGNEPYYVNGRGSYSLSLPSGSSAVSPAACVNLLSPYLRMFANDANGRDSGLDVEVRFYGLTGNLTGILNVATLDPGDHATWQPTAPVSTALALPLGTSSFRLRLAPGGWGSNWRVDDVFVDPWLNVGG